MNLDEAIRITEILEADDVIGVTGLACRTLYKEVQKLQEENENLRLEVGAWQDQTGD